MKLLKYRFRQGWFGKQILQVCRNPPVDQPMVKYGWGDATQEEADQAYIVVEKSSLNRNYDFRKDFFGSYVLYVKCTCEEIFCCGDSTFYDEWVQANHEEARVVFLVLNESL